MQTNYPWQHDPSRPTPLPVSSDPTLVGIRGWLLLPAFGLIIGLLARVAGLVATAKQGGMMVPVALVIDGGMAILLLVAALAFFRHQRKAPKLLIAYLWANLAVLGVLLLFVGTQVLPETVGAGVAAALWTAYFHHSERVRATFTR